MGQRVSSYQGLERGQAMVWEVPGSASLPAKCCTAAGGDKANWDKTAKGCVLSTSEDHKTTLSFEEVPHPRPFSPRGAATGSSGMSKPYRRGCDFSGSHSPA